MLPAGFVIDARRRRTMSTDETGQGSNQVQFFYSIGMLRATQRIPTVVVRRRSTAPAGFSKLPLATDAGETGENKAVHKLALQLEEAETSVLFESMPLHSALCFLLMEMVNCESHS
jgi:hypothetical protein